MAGFVKGDVIVVPFPFSDLSAAKRRPALVIAALEGDDVILCQITSKTLKDRYSIAIDDTDFHTSGLHQPSNIRPNRLFTADSHLILYSIGSLRPSKLESVLDKIVEIIRH